MGDGDGENLFQGEIYWNLWYLSLPVFTFAATSAFQQWRKTPNKTTQILATAHKP